MKTSGLQLGFGFVLGLVLLNRLRYPLIPLILSNYIPCNYIKPFRTFAMFSDDPFPYSGHTNLIINHQLLDYKTVGKRTQTAVNNSPSCAL